MIKVEIHEIQTHFYSFKRWNTNNISLKALNIDVIIEDMDILYVVVEKILSRSFLAILYLTMVVIKMIVGVKVAKIWSTKEIEKRVKMVWRLNNE